MRFLARRIAFALLATVSLLVPMAAVADDDMDAASQAALAAQVPGPSRVALGTQASLALPEGFSYIPRTEAARLMDAMGNITGPDFLGLIVGERIDGFVSIDFTPAGYVRDDDARDWDAGDLLQNLKDGTEVGNEERRRRGIPEFVVDRWVEPPRYDATSHRLVWSVRLRDKYPVGQEAPGVNYNTYLLGREGYIEMNLVTDLASVDSQKPVAAQLLDAVNFNQGKRYADFNEDTDTVAAYGLAALVGGVAAKKAGLLAAIGIFLVKFWKLAIIGVIAFGAGIRRFFGGKKEAGE